MHYRIEAIEAKINQAVGNLESCDSESLRGLAIECVRAMTDSAIGSVERKVLADTAETLMGEDAHGRHTSRLSAIGQAAHSIRRIREFEAFEKSR